MYSNKLLYGKNTMERIVSIEADSKIYGEEGYKELLEIPADMDLGKEHKDWQENQEKKEAVRKGFIEWLIERGAKEPDIEIFEY